MLLLLQTGESENLMNMMRSEGASEQLAMQVAIGESCKKNLFQ